MTFNRISFSSTKRNRERASDGKRSDFVICFVGASAYWSRHYPVTLPCFQEHFHFYVKRSALSKTLTLKLLPTGQKNSVNVRFRVFHPTFCGFRAVGAIRCLPLCRTLRKLRIYRNESKKKTAPRSCAMSSIT